ncbi:MAG: DegV family protein [Lachnospiraceae bacterium]|nr:DegV family protein [Lachnospiraceae bacterium]
MGRIAVVTDSNSGITQKEAAALGIYVLPMPFRIDDGDYYEDINITQAEFYERIGAGAAVSTSQPSPADVKSLWDRLLKDHDQIVHIPMSSGLSGSCQSARMLAEDYGGRVEVIDNQRISVTLRRSCLDAQVLAQRGSSAAEIRQKLEETGLDASIYIMLDTLSYLKRGGRITPAAAAIGTLLKIKPVLQIQGEKLDAFAKARTSAQGKKIMLQAIAADIEKRFGGLGQHDVVIDMAYTNDEEALLAFRREAMEEFPWAGDIHYDPLSLSVGCHIGPGAIAITAIKNQHFSEGL